MSEKRQSAPGSNVDPTSSSKAARAQRIGSRIRARMMHLGWVDGEGEPDVRKLRDAVARVRFGDAGNPKPRWQTAQFWVLGTSPPRGEYGAALAEALGVTLDELAGLALGQEPETEAWKAFVASDLGTSMTPEERSTLASRRALPGKSLSEAYYRSDLLNLRAHSI